MQGPQLRHHFDMKRTIVIILLGLGLSARGQFSCDAHIFSDTSVYFIYQRDSLNPVQLTQEELAIAEQLFLKAVSSFNEQERHMADSLNPNKKKRKSSALQIDPCNYFFRVIPVIVGGYQKGIYISGTCKHWFSNGKRRGVLPVYWKERFIDGEMVEDGGACFLYLAINLATRSPGLLRINGQG